MAVHIAKKGFSSSKVVIMSSKALQINTNVGEKKVLMGLSDMRGETVNNNRNAAIPVREEISSGMCEVVPRPIANG